MKSFARWLYDTALPTFIGVCLVVCVTFLSFGAAWWAVRWVLRMIGVTV